MVKKNGTCINKKIEKVIDAADKPVNKYVFKEFNDFILFGEKSVKVKK